MEEGNGQDVPSGPDSGGTAIPEGVEIVAGKGRFREPRPMASSSVIGIGTSDGSLDDLRRFLSSVPEESGMSFVVAAHRSSDRDQVLPEVLRGCTSMRLLEAKECMPLLPDTVYVSPAGTCLCLRGDKLCIGEPSPELEQRYPIDQLFRSLAAELEERAMAVVLSGAGSDGVEGARAIRGAGGVVFVQAPGAVEYSGMGLGVIESGAANAVLPVNLIPARLIEIAEGAGSLESEKRISAELDEQLHAVFRTVKSATGNDFSFYKTSTVMRRIERRMAMNNVGSLGDYVAMLKGSPQEAVELCREFLIGVTSFFRDPEAFETIKKLVIPRIFAGRDPDDPVRIWHACCASGEEAYSTAILISEYLSKRQMDARVQIFATDIDEGAIARARAGIFHEGIEADLSRERLRRFFTLSNGRYQVIKQLREMIIFSHHNLIRDPPFSRLDLLVCRNFLIYLNPEMQMRLIPLFHQVLKSGGTLFLGGSETIERNSDLFVSVDKKWKIFRRNDVERRPDSAFPISSRVRVPACAASAGHPSVTDEQTPGTVVEKLLMERYSPPCVVVNEKYELVYVSTRNTGLFLELPPGEPSRDILRMAREELRPTLRAAIHKAFSGRKQAVFRGVRICVNGADVTLNVLAEPLSLPASRGRLAMIVFDYSPASDSSAPAISPAGIGAPGNESPENALIRQLEEQLLVSHEQLQATIEQLETSNEGLLSANEELMSTNEEFQATNEELQSTNEELETSREELQALNEELVTVNAELQQKVEELDLATSDMENLLNGSEIATLFLDRQLNIKRFTPAMAGILDLIPSDIGRPFIRMAKKILWPEFTHDAATVLKDEVSLEREVTTPEDGRCYIMRILPYRSGIGGVAGIVVTFIDFTERKRDGEALRRAKEEWERTFNSVPDLIAILDERHRIVQVNRAMAERLGREPDDCSGLPCYAVVHGLDGPPEFCPHSMTLADALEHEAEVHEELLGGDFLVSTTPLADPAGRMVGAVHVARDITGRKLVEGALRRSEEMLRRLTDHLPCYICYVDRGERYLFANETYRTWFALDPEEVLGLTVAEVVGPENYALIKPRIDKVLAGRPVSFDYSMKLAAGSQKFVNATYVPDVDADGEVRGFYATVINLTERKRAEEALRQSEERWQFAIEGSSDGVWDRNIQTGEVFFSHQWKEMLGFTDVEIGSSLDEWSKRIHPDDLLRVQGELEKHLRGESAKYRAEFRMLCKDDSYKWILARGKVISRTEEGEPIRFVGTQSDITERRNLEAQLYQAQKMEAVGQLAGGVAHDFNNILTAILGFSHLLAMQMGEEDRLRHFVEQIRVSAERAADLTKALLAFSRKQVMVSKVINLNDTVLCVRDILRRLISESIELRFDIHRESLHVMADGGKLEQVLMNLATNARDAMPRGGVIVICTSRVHLNGGLAREQDCIRPGDYACLSVRDTGCGMSRETRLKIFEPFFTTKEVGKGTGLGLSIVYGIVKQHNGCIEVNSETGKGTVFNVFLPLAEPDEGFGGEGERLPPPHGTGTVLLAEDDDPVREFHKMLFESAGYRVIPASHGMEAYEKFLKHEKEIDLLVFDVIMPKMNGKEASELIRKKRPGIKTLFLSGYAGEILNEAGVVRGREIILDKPVKPTDLLRSAHELLREDPPFGTGLDD